VKPWVLPCVLSGARRRSSASWENDDVVRGGGIPPATR
jgi:hypothetical protein